MVKISDNNGETTEISTWVREKRETRLTVF